MENIYFKKTIPVKYDVDVFIAGGGTSGIAAAVTASNQGARVFVAEAHSCFGGMGTAGMVPMFMQFTSGELFLADGFGRKIYDRVLAAGGKQTGKYLTIPAEDLKRIYDNMAIESGFDFLFHTCMIDVVKQGSRLKYAICSTKSGLFAIKARHFIDCTGDGDLAFRANAEFEKGDENCKLMPGTLCSLWANIDWQKAGTIEPKDHKIALEKAFIEKIFTVEDRHHSGIVQTGDTLGTGNIGHIFDLDATDEKSLTMAYIAGRKYLTEYRTYYRKYFKGFAQAEIAASASLLGIRETRRITCDYRITIDDFINRRKFSDQIGCYCYQVDIHPSTAGIEDLKKFQSETTKYCYKPREYYGIPFRALTVKGFDNLIVAGRCICSDRYMQSSVRAMPGCFITGQAAGMAAAIASEETKLIRNVNIDVLRKRLKRIGAFV